MPVLGSRIPWISDPKRLSSWSLGKGGGAHRAETIYSYCHPQPCPPCRYTGTGFRLALAHGYNGSLLDLVPIKNT